MLRLVLLRARGLRFGLHGLGRLAHGPAWLLAVAVVVVAVLAIAASRRGR